MSTPPIALALLALLPATFGMTPATSQEDGKSGYQKPPAKIVEVLTAAPSPLVQLSPDGEWMVHMEYAAMPDIGELSRPMLALAGRRIDPVLSASFRTRFYLRLSLHPTIATPDAQAPAPIALPGGARVMAANWSHDSRRIALQLATDSGQELWVVTVDKPGEPKRVAVDLNSVMVSPFWAPDGNHLIALVNAPQRGTGPKPIAAPRGPNIQESLGNTTPTRTFQDLLSSSHDEALFVHHATAQALLISSEGEQVPIGKPDLFAALSLSPNGQYLLVERLHKPFSYLLTLRSFPRAVEVQTLDGKVVRTIADLPLEENIPIGGVAEGPRKVQWLAASPASLIWVEAKDGGDPKAKADHRDQLLTLAAPFEGTPEPLAKLQHRLWEVRFLHNPDALITREYDRDRRWVRSLLHDRSPNKTEPRVLEDRSIRDRYGNPGFWVRTSNQDGKSVLYQEGPWAFRAGQGASDKGDLPFLDRYNLETGQSERLWRSEPGTYEMALALQSGAEAGKPRAITQHETQTSPPNLRLWDLQTNSTQPLTRFADPTPAVRKIKKKLVRYERADGVPHSATLYLPADYEPGTRLPLLLWAYPTEFTDKRTASQIQGSPHRFTRMEGSSHLILATQGYAILDNPSMPVIGDVETMNDTFLDQIVASAQAAIDHAVELGVADPDRVAVGGHSYGAFMTANLLAHCDLFQAGVARSGAYNRTLTPFGFQAEQRPLWQAKDVYFNLSPFLQADLIDEPLLLIHGERDNNSGTFPLQSKRMFQAIKGNGGTVRLVMLPQESHGYRALQSVLHVQAETIAWLDKYVKNAPKKEPAAEKVEEPALPISDEG